MADADEDAIFHPTSTDSAPQVEVDLSEEMQDFRFLNSLSLATDTSQTALPRRGEKDFEPNPTMLQSNVLAAARDAMYNAISHPRLHGVKTQILGTYAPDGPRPPRVTEPTNKEEQQDVERGTDVRKAEKPITSDLLSNINPDACVMVPSPKGSFFKSVGKADRWNRVWLLPEEALYLIERGTLDIRWPSEISGTAPQEDGKSPEIPMSLQAAYACMMGHGGLTMERYSVYTGLKRLGYTVVRAPSWDGTTEEPQQETKTKSTSFGFKDLADCWNRYYNSIAGTLESDHSAQGPLIGFNTYRNYTDIFRKLAIIPAEDAAVENPERQPTQAPFQFTYYVYKPSTSYKKVAPPPPDFRIAVVDARSHTSIPTLRQISALIESSPYEPPKGEAMERHLYARLRQGYRSAILAIVDQGVVSYLRLSDAGFSKERLFESQGPPKGNKGGGQRKNGGKNKGR